MQINSIPNKKNLDLGELKVVASTTLNSLLLYSNVVYGSIDIGITK